MRPVILWVIRGAAVQVLLFRIDLDARASVPVVEEVLPGIEQLQLQFLEEGQYKNADKVKDWSAVSAVQLWVLVRSECPEQALKSLHPDLPALTLADVSLPQDEGRFRRKIYRRVFARRNLP